MTNKQETRQAIKLELKMLNQNKELCSQKSKSACNSVINSSLYKEANAVFLFLSYGTEIQTETLIQNVLKSDKDLYLPRTEDDKMFFYKIEKSINLENQLEQGDFGIFVPTKNHQKWDFSMVSASDKENFADILVIVPGLGFDKAGNRLGKGRGYYDKFLSTLLDFGKNKKRIVGLCYDLQLKSTIPTERTDVKMHYVASESGLICCC